MPWLNRLNAKDVPESHHLRQVRRLLSRGPHWFKAEARDDQSVIEAGCVYLYPYSPGTNTRSTCDFFLLLARHYQNQHLAAESGFGDYMYIFI